MNYPQVRPRRLRRSKAVRDLVRETEIDLSHLIYPLFVVPGAGIKQPVAAMPGVFRFSGDTLLKEIAEIWELGIRAIILFGAGSPADPAGTAAYDPGQPVQAALRAVKDRYPGLLLITDVCLCGYTTHGHCGLVEGEEILNDPTLEILARTAVSHAAAGADIVAPSDMMDGRVAAIRKALDHAGHTNTSILSYAVKYASSFYGPFRDAACCAPSFGDRRTYQMDPGNTREALKEAQLDLTEGADILMIKPALAYLDIIRMVKENTLNPVFAYNVSGEYAMIKAAAVAGYLNENDAVKETLLSMRRAGADRIITYHAKDFACYAE